MFSNCCRSKSFFLLSPLFIALTACGGGGGGSSTTITPNDQDAPTVSSFTPDDGARDVSTDTQVSVTFSEKMSGDSVNESTITLKGENGLSSVVGFSDEDGNGNGTTATLNAQPLPPLSTLTATVTTDVRDISTNQLGSPVTWSFTTEDGNWAVASERRNRPVRELQLVSDPLGNATVVWVEDNNAGPGPRVQASRYQPGSDWQESEGVAQYETAEGVVDVLSPSLAANASGVALAVFFVDNDDDDISANRYINGGWESNVAPSISRRTAPEVGRPVVALNNEGDGLAVWQERERVSGSVFNLRASRFTPEIDDDDGTNFDDRWSSPVTLAADDNPSADATDARVAIGPGDNALVVYLNGDTVQALNFGLDDDYTAATPETLSVNGGAAAELDLAIGEGGNAVATWTQDGEVYVSRYDAGSGNWGTAENLPFTGAPGGDDAFEPNVAINGDSATAVWREGSGIGSAIVASRFITGNWEDALQISDTSLEVGDPGVGIDAAGNALAIWVQSGTAGEAREVATSRLTAGDDWENVEVISDANGEVKTPRISVNANGNAAAAWLQENENGNFTPRTSNF